MCMCMYYIYIYTYTLHHTWGLHFSTCTFHFWSLCMEIKSLLYLSLNSIVKLHILNFFSVSIFKQDSCFRDITERQRYQGRAICNDCTWHTWLFKYIHIGCGRKMISIYHLDYFIVENFVQEGERSKDDENSKIQMKARERLSGQWWEWRKFRHTHKSSQVKY